MGRCIEQSPGSDVSPWALSARASQRGTWPTSHLCVHKVGMCLGCEFVRGAGSERWGTVTWNQLWKTEIIVCCFSVDFLQCDTRLFVTPLLVKAEEHILPFLYRIDTFLPERS